MFRFFISIATFLVLALLSVPSIAAARTGIIDSRARWILPADFVQIRYIAPNLYEIISTSGSYPERIKFVDGNGFTVNVPVRTDGNIVGVLAKHDMPAASQSDIWLIVQARESSGVIDVFGKVVVPFRDWEIEGYSDEVFVAERTRLVPPNRYDSHVENTTYFVDEQGKILGTFDDKDYDPPEASAVSEGIFCARSRKDGHPLYSCFDITGNKLALPEQTEPVLFHCGYALVPTVVGKRAPLCYVNRDGQRLAERVFDDARPFEDGMAVVATADSTGSGWRYGVIDTNGHERLPLKYLSVYKADKASFFVEETSHQWLLISAEGAIKRTFPPGWHPVCYRDGFLDCRVKDGDREEPILVDSEDRVNRFYPGKCQSPQPFTDVMVDSARKRSRYGVRNNHGWLIPARYSGLTAAGTDRWIGSVRSEHFDRDEWNHGYDGYSFNRGEEFAKFLQDYDLIGMSRQEVIRLLGDDEQKPDGSGRYELYGGFCGNASQGILIDFSDEKVKRWQFIAMMDSRPVNRMPEKAWIADNVVFAGPFNEFMRLEKMVPKRQSAEYKGH